MGMKLTEFLFDLPKELIAQYPAHNRDESRLMVVNRKTGEIKHHDKFSAILEYFDESDVFVMNDTKVFPARLFGNKEKTGAQIEVFLLRELNAESRLWDVLVDPARKIRIGNKLYFGDDDLLVAEVIDNTTSRGRTLRFLFDGTYEEFRHTLKVMGETPIPHHIERPVEPMDEERFQTIFAKHEGAVAVSTAGLHFSRELMKRLEIRGVDFAYLTLHLGLGTFKPVDVEDLTKHKMDSEELIINEDCVRRVNKAVDERRKICAVGAATLRSMETSSTTTGYIKTHEGWSNKFIFPPYDFSVANSLITNFQLPGSTLLMMTAAFGGYDLIMEAYKVAIKEKYRFLDYGDAMLII
jgi:S-adenosylmethionine:tRNA ribosyltransferase-isomerase